MSKAGVPLKNAFLGQGEELMAGDLEILSHMTFFVLHFVVGGGNCFLSKFYARLDILMSDRQVATFLCVGSWFHDRTCNAVMVVVMFSLNFLILPVHLS